MKTDTQLEAVLSRDPIAESEKVLGKHYTKFDHDERGISLGLALLTNERKSEALKARDDTTFVHPLTDYLRIIDEIGFREVLKIPFVGRKEHHNPDGDDLYVFFRDKGGLLLVFDTYNRKTVNGGKFYYNWRQTYPIPPGVKVTSSYSHHDGVLAGYHDCREAIRYNIAKLEEYGEFVTPWKSQPFLWLCHYGDTATNYSWEESERYRTINAERIARLPEDVRKVIGEPR